MLLLEEHIYFYSYCNGFLVLKSITFLNGLFIHKYYDHIEYSSGILLGIEEQKYAHTVETRYLHTPNKKAHASFFSLSEVK